MSSSKEGYINDQRVKFLDKGNPLDYKNRYDYDR